MRSSFLCPLYDINLENLIEDKRFDDNCGVKDFPLHFFNLLELFECPADEESSIPLRVSL